MSPRRVLVALVVSALSLSAAACGGQEEAATPPPATSTTSTPPAPEVGTAANPAPSSTWIESGPWKIRVETLAAGDSAGDLLDRLGHEPYTAMRVGDYVIFRVHVQNASGLGSQAALADSFVMGDPGASADSLSTVRPQEINAPDVPNLAEASEDYATGTTTGYLLFDTFGPEMVPDYALIFDPGGTDNRRFWQVNW